MSSEDPAARLITFTKHLLRCDTARIWESEFSRQRFLIIGEHKRSEGEWVRVSDAGEHEPITFDYTAEKVIASGHSWEELKASVKEYKRLCGLTMEAYLHEQPRY